MWEWTLDWYANYATTCDNCADLTATSNRVIRGGYFDNYASGLRSANRDGYYPWRDYFNVGARCARTSL